MQPTNGTTVVFLLLHRVAEATTCILTMNSGDMQPHLLLEDLDGGCPPYYSLFLPKQAILSIKGLHPFIDRMMGGKSS